MRTMRRKNFNIKKMSRDYSFEKEANWPAGAGKIGCKKMKTGWLSIHDEALNSYHYKLLRIFLLV